MNPKKAPVFTEGAEVSFAGNSRGTVESAQWVTDSRGVGYWRLRLTNEYGNPMAVSEEDCRPVGHIFWQHKNDFPVSARTSLSDLRIPPGMVVIGAFVTPDQHTRIRHLLSQPQQAAPSPLAPGLPLDAQLGLPNLPPRGTPPMPKPQADRCPTCNRKHPTPEQIAGKSRRQLKYLRKIHELARIGRKVAEGA